MKGAFVPLIAAALLLALSPAGPLAAAPAPAARADSYTFAFQNADVGQVAEEILGRTLGVAYAVDPEVTGKISFRIEQRLTRAQLLEAFEAALAANGVVLVRNGESVTLIPRAKAKSAAGLRTASEGGGLAGYEVVAVPLSYATPSEVAKALQSMGRSDLVVYTDDKLGLIVLGGSERELDSARQTLKVLDQSSLQDSKIRWFDLTQAPAETVGEELDKILEGAGATGVRIVALKRLNGVLAFGHTPEALDQVGRWIEKLDVPGKDETPQLWVYHPLNITADALAGTLNAVLYGVAQSSAPAAPSQPLGFAISSTGSAGGAAPTAETAPAAAPPASSGAGAAPASFSSSADNVRIGVNRESNTMVITAPPSRWVQIKRILDEIDRSPGQVLIEASVLEVTLTNELSAGVNWSFVASNGKLTIVNSNNKTATIAPSFPGLGVTYLDNNIQAAVDALKAVTTVEVVSAPKLVTLDNHIARLQVGDQVPVSIQSSQGTANSNAPLITTTEYRDTGVILNVTPRIAGPDQVVLDVDQEVSNVARTTSSGIDSPTIEQRRIQGTLALTDGQTMALGGMISSTRSLSDSGVPWIKDIPLLGHAFKSTDDNGDRKELIVLITARIMKDASTSEKVMKDLMGDMKEIESRGLASR
jgi:general secretion pathway protein D